MSVDKIIVKGAKIHNLKNINVEIPRNKLTVITGLSGSGKSSLAFDTIYAEGQRRYVESLSTYARQFLQLMEKPEVDSIYTLIKLKLARKHFESANIYRKVSEFEAAIVYYDQVIIDYYDSPYAGQSKFWKGYCNYKIGEFQKATLIFKKFIDDYPQEKNLVEDAHKLLVKIKEKEEKERTKKKASIASETIN